MESHQVGEEVKYNETEKRWNRKKTGAFIIALLIVVLNILALALGTIIGAVPISLSIGCVGVITFIGVLTLSNYLSSDPELAKKEMRKAIAASFTLVYLVFLALVVFSEDFIAETELAETVVGHFTWIVGIIMIFYFGSRSLEEYLKRKEKR
jgi:cobalamin synthase